MHGGDPPERRARSTHSTVYRTRLAVRTLTVAGHLHFAMTFRTLRRPAPGAGRPDSAKLQNGSSSDIIMWACVTSCRGDGGCARRPTRRTSAVADFATNSSFELRGAAAWARPAGRAGLLGSYPVPARHSIAAEGRASSISARRVPGRRDRIRPGSELIDVVGRYGHVALPAVRRGKVTSNSGERVGRLKSTRSRLAGMLSLPWERSRRLRARIYI